MEKDDDEALERRVKDALVEVFLNAAIRVEQAVPLGSRAVTHALNLAIADIAVAKAGIVASVIVEMLENSPDDCGDPDCPEHGSARLPREDLH